MAIRIYYVIDRSGKLSPRRLREGIREALADLGLPLLDNKNPKSAYETNPDAVVYRVIIEPVEREKPEASA